MYKILFFLNFILFNSLDKIKVLQNVNLKKERKKQEEKSDKKRKSSFLPFSIFLANKQKFSSHHSNMCKI